MDYHTNTVGGSDSGMANFPAKASDSVPVNAQNTSSTNDQTAANYASPGAQSSAQQQPQNPTQMPLNSTSISNNNIDDVELKTTAGVPAEDSDLIEKEWVNRAKAIVENTQNNPFLKNQELAKLRTEYLQKRYGKSIQEGM